MEICSLYWLQPNEQVAGYILKFKKKKTMQEIFAFHKWALTMGIIAILWF